uniref:Uncharacterized protein n=1 Tax=Sinocyclocheilus grahami TaxID=75366 RepID=A0A672K159_SINGR
MFEFIKPIRFSGQDYNTLKQEYLQKKGLFEDESFPATVDSLACWKKICFVCTFC